MAHEIWQWIKEKLQAAKVWLSRMIKHAWLRFIGFLADLPASVWKRIAIALPIIFILYIIVGMALVHRIDDTLVLDIKDVPGTSATVEMAASLVEREVITNRWTPNDPFFMPAWWLDNTPAYQSGIISALSRFSIELRDQLGRSRGSSTVDADLASAASNLAIEGERWVMDFNTSFLPTTPSETYYKDAIKQLRAYNTRLFNQQAIYEQRSDNFLATLDRIAQDLGSASATLDNYIDENSGGFLPDTGADNLFYQIKGKAYAYTLLLHALEKDFSRVIADRDIASVYQELLKSMDAVTMLDPIIVTNGKKDGILANHLASQGFNLLRARTQLKEITNILLK